VLFLPDVNIEKVESYIVSNRDKIDCVIFDSIQTMWDPNVQSSSGNVAQISECTNRIVNLAKAITLLPLLLAMLLNQAILPGQNYGAYGRYSLYLEGDKRYEFRILRVEKNRFGSSDEVVYLE